MKADDLLGPLRAAFDAHADPKQAAGMAAYMRDRYAFAGIQTPLRRKLTREVLAPLPAPSERELTATARRLWREPQREYQYVGSDYLALHAPRVASARFVDVLQELVLAKSWWDTVDSLASPTLGSVVLRHPRLRATMDRWIRHDDFWVQRASLLHQLRYGAKTDQERLFAACLALAPSPEFFLRKAIGWALRAHTRVAPDAVRGFVADHADVLSPLSRREALKWLDRKRR